MDERAAIAAWKAEPNGPKKHLLLSQFIRSKHGLIRQLTVKAARAERTAEDLDDLFQAGCIGFMKALEKFDLDRKIAISTYAAWWVRHEVQKAARRAPTVSLPRIRLTNEERHRVIEAVRVDPAVTPEALGVKRGQLEQVRHSVGVRFLSDATPKGERAIERSTGDGIDMEETIDRNRAYRAIDEVLDKVRRGATAAELGLPPDAYAAALELIEDEKRPRRLVMVDMANGVTGPAAPAARRKPAAKPKKQAAGVPTETEQEHALRVIIASKLGRLTLPELEQIAARLLSSKAA